MTDIDTRRRSPLKTCAITAVLASIIAGGAFTWVRMSQAAQPPAKEFAADKGPSKVEISSYPKEVQDNYAVFASKCSKCHTLARPINTNLKPEEWKMYVKRMMNKPDSGISPDQGKKVYQFLKFWQDEKDKKPQP